MIAVFVRHLSFLPIALLSLFVLNHARADVRQENELSTARKGKFKKLGVELELGRSGHCLSLLSDERVFIAGGGWGDWGGEAKAEIIDLRSGNVHTVQKQMMIPRSNARLATLSDGRVMLLGGAADFEMALNSTEIFDPASENIQPGPLMQFERDGHTATALPNGQIVVVGGSDAEFMHDSIELYDPKNQSFTTLPITLQIPRMNHTATLLGGRFLVIAGGETGTSRKNPEQESSFLDSIEILDTLKNKMIVVQERLQVPRTFHTALAINEQKIVFVGGLSAVGKSSSALDVFELSTLSIRASGELTTPRSLHTTALLSSGELFVSGGVANGTPQKSTERCRLNAVLSFECRRDASMSLARWMHENLMLPDGRLLVLGGLTNVAEPGRKRPGPSHTAEIFSP